MKRRISLSYGSPMRAAVFRHFLLIAAASVLVFDALNGAFSGRGHPVLSQSLVLLPVPGCVRRVPLVARRGPAIGRRIESVFKEGASEKLRERTAFGCNSSSP